MQKLFHEKFTGNHISLGEVHKEHVYVEGLRKSELWLANKVRDNWL